MPVALVTDSTCYAAAADAAALGLRIVPLRVSLGDWSFDEPDVEPREFYRRLREAGDLRPTTSQPSPGAFAAAFGAAAADGLDRVLCITCGAALSGTHGSARLAAGTSPVPVDLVDSGTISGGLLLLVAAAARALSDGTPYDEVLAAARASTGRVWSTWSADTTRLLSAGGRLGAAPGDGPGVAVLALEGEVRVLGEATSVEDAVRLQAETVRAALARRPGRVTVGHGDVPELADALAAAISGAPGLAGIDRYVVGPAVGAHAGPGNVGASYLAAPVAPAR